MVLREFWSLSFTGVWPMYDMGAVSVALPITITEVQGTSFKKPSGVQTSLSALSLILRIVKLVETT